MDSSVNRATAFQVGHEIIIVILNLCIPYSFYVYMAHPHRYAGAYGPVPPGI